MSDPQTEEIGPLFLEYSINRLEQMRLAIHVCFERLNDDLIWRRDVSNQNTIGNLVLHLCGNVRQWIGAYVGGLKDTRNRDAEFATECYQTCTGLLALLDETVGMAVDTLRRVESAKLVERIGVQDGRTLSVLEAIYQVVGHFQLHAGQIMFATKLWTGQDLGIYRPLPPQPAV